MFCEKCGNQLNDSDRFCAVCGTAVNKETLVPENAPIFPNTVAKRKMGAKEIIAIILTAIGMAVAVAGSVLSATNHSNLLNAEKQLATIKSEISAAQNSILGDLLGDMSSLYGEALNQCQASVTHYKQLVYGGIIAAVVGAVVAIASILYIFVFKKDESLINNAPDSTNIPYFPVESVNDAKIPQAVPKEEFQGEQTDTNQQINPDTETNN